MKCGSGLRKRVSSMSDGVRVMWMRSGTSKGGYFLHDDLPLDEPSRDAVLMRIMGSQTCVKLMAWEGLIR